MKPQARILTVSKGRNKKGDQAWFIGTIYRGGKLFEGLIKFSASLKDSDVSDGVINSILRSRHRSQIRVTILDGFKTFPTTLEGLNKIFQETSIPVIALERKRTGSRSDPNSSLGFCSKPKGGSPYITFYKPFILYVAGLNPKHVREFARLYLKNGKNPPNLDSTRVIAKAYNVFQERVKRRSPGYWGRKDGCICCEVLP